MLRHNLELAFQQMRKYAMQSTVSIVSLAIGFACFALASMWIKYETTYDAFHRDAGNIYVYTEGGAINTYSDSEKFDQIPEIAVHTMFSRNIVYDSINGRCMKVEEHLVFDENFPKVFTLQIIEGNDGFLHDEKQVAVSDRLARELWGTESPIGKELRVNSKLPAHKSRTVTGVFKDWGAHTNYNMDMMGCVPKDVPWSVSLLKYAVLRLHKSSDADIVRDKLLAMHNGVNQTPDIIQITEFRHRKSAMWTSGVKINHIYLFVFASLLLIICGLLNYLVMFVNRLFIRKHEITLRTMLGAHNWDILLQFIVEYGLLLVFALVFGVAVVSVCEKFFLELTGLPLESGYIYGEMGIYAFIVCLLSLLISVPVIYYFRNQTLQNSAKGTGSLNNYNSFRRISMGVQMCITIFCIFCVAVMLRQLDALRHEDIGFKRENRGYVKIEETNWSIRNSKVDEILSFLKEMPEIDMAYVTDYSFFPGGFLIIESMSPDVFPQLDKEKTLKGISIDENFAEFYEPTLLAGRWLAPGEKDKILINETTARTLGWEQPVGELFRQKSYHPDKPEKSLQVVGVIKDILLTPTQKADNWKLEYRSSLNQWPTILFKYKSGTWLTVRKKLIDLYAKNEWGKVTPCTLEEEYEKMLVSENKLQKLLFITTGVCILISLFGVWSMIMLTCEQRRKEIAVRKVFGATGKDILDMFFVEYMIVLGGAAIVAFPIGYACMKPWMEQYVVQTGVAWWIFVGIFLLVALLVALCIGWRVWKTATAHPAEEIAIG